MFSESMIIDEINKDWNVLVWTSARGIVKSNRREIIKHLKSNKQHRIAFAVGCGCSLCLKAVSHLEVKQKDLHMTNDIQHFLDSVKSLSGQEAKQAEIDFMKKVIEKELRKAFALQKEKNEKKKK